MVKVEHQKIIKLLDYCRVNVKGGVPYALSMVSYFLFLLFPLLYYLFSFIMLCATVGIEPVAAFGHVTFCTLKVAEAVSEYHILLHSSTVPWPLLGLLCIYYLHAYVSNNILMHSSTIPWPLLG